MKLIKSQAHASEFVYSPKRIDFINCNISDPSQTGKYE